MRGDEYYEKLKFSSSEIKKTFYIGKESQIEAGLGVLCQVLSDQKYGLPTLDYKILLFGQSGSGKSLYPEGLAKNFISNGNIAKLIQNEKKRSSKVNNDFTLFHVKCHDMVSAFGSETSLKRFLRKMVVEINDSKPAVVAFDELDAFTPERMRMAPLSPNVFYWTMSFMQKRKRGLVVLGILNHPDILEAAVLSRIDNLLYFEELDRTIVEAVLKNKGIPYASELALKMCTSTKVIVLGNELTNACEKIIQTLGQGDPKNLTKYDPQEITDAMMPWLKTSWARRRLYEEANGDHISKGKEAMAFWNKRYQFFLGNGL